MPSQTIAQVHAQPSAHDGHLPRRPLSVDGIERSEPWAKKVRKMRRDPTIKLARLLLAAPILAARWSYEEKDDAPADARDMISRNMDPLRLSLMDHTVRGWLDHGWAPFEKIYEVSDDSRELRLKKLKPLLQDLTHIVVDPATGAYNGLENVGTTLPVEETLTLYNEVEGTYWYGTAMMEACEEPYDAWKNVDGAANRYDTRIAGTHWVIYYPIGESMFNGVETDNYEIAKAILTSLEASGRVIVPRNVDEVLMQLEQGSKSAWSIELLSDNGSGTTSFVERMKYLDALKVRGLGLPERAVLEGQYGTKAESEAQGDFAITNMEIKHEGAVDIINPHVVDHLLELHYGRSARGSVWISPQPITDLQRAYLRKIYSQIISNPQGFLTEAVNIDLESLKEKIGIPIDESGDELDRLIDQRPGADPEEESDEAPFDITEEPA